MLMLYAFVVNWFSLNFSIVQMESTVHEDNLKKVMDMGMKGCQMVYTVLNTFVREHLQANLK